MIDCYISELGYWKDYSKKEFKRYVYVPTSFVSKLVHERYSNKGVFKTVYSYSSRDIEKSFVVGDFYLDFDDNENFENVREDVLKSIRVMNLIFKIKVEEIKIFYSGSKGIHLTVDKEILGVYPHENLNIAFKYMANIIRNQTKHKTIDIQIYDKKRLFRIENSIHEKSNLHKIRLSYNELQSMPLDNIKSLARNMRIVDDSKPKLNENAKTSFNYFLEKSIKEFEEMLSAEYYANLDKVIRDVPPCIKHLLDEGPIDGTRNNILAILVSFYKSKGLSFQETKELVIKWSDEQINLSEIMRTLNSMYFSNKKYGCRSLKIHSVCDYNNCQLMKGKKRKDEKPKNPR